MGIVDAPEEEVGRLSCVSGMRQSSKRRETAANKDRERKRKKANRGTRDSALTKQSRRERQHAVRLTKTLDPEPFQSDDPAQPEQAPVRQPRQGGREEQVRGVV